ncbi:MAG: hypothetical protein Fur0021_12820 [Candidatus Promineifilaceae bacterium]
MEFIGSLQNTPLPTILVVGGILLLVLAVASELGGKITIAPQRQKSALILGIGLLAIGVALYFIPGSNGKEAEPRSEEETVTPGAPTAMPAAPTAPVVVSTIPESGAVNVPATLTEIVVVFSVDMRTDSWSFVASTAGETPEITGDPAFRNARTCVLPVRLAAGTTYALGINSATHQGFVSAAGGNVPAMPYTLTFSTAR